MKLTVKEKDELLAEGFAPDQISEIDEGKREGLDTSIYEKKEYLAIQMRQIRLGLQDGLKVEYYTNPEYDWFQMEEIRKGLKDGQDVRIYAYPEIAYDTMHQLRKGLKEGMNLYRYRGLKAGILKQFRKATASGVNIVKYIKEGYDTEQLMQIRQALEKGLDIEPYLLKEFRGAAIAEISKGLERGIDVSVYAGIEYSWQQMREIRLGLENRIDVTPYLSAFYSAMQMKEIRLGIESGIDVSSYRSLMYTPNEMHKRRLALQNNTIEENKHERRIFPRQDKDAASDIVLTDYISVSISEDEMEAHIKLEKTGYKFSEAAIINTLRICGIKAGIITEALKMAVETFNNNAVSQVKEPILIAKGVAPKDGEDGWYEFFFKSQNEFSPEMELDGSVDYNNTKWFDMVKKGEKIAYYHEAGIGVDGYTVSGKVLPAKKGREKSLLTGKGFMLMPDKKTYLAIDDGKIDRNNNNIEISRMLVLDDMTTATGKVEFDGSVYIRGNVGSGANLKATEDIIVDGFVESANMESGGSIVLRMGANACGNGSIRAEKNVTGKFFESVDVYAGGDIHANCCMNANLYAEGKVIISGTSGTLVGGTTCAGKGLNAYNVGNHVGLPTHIRIGASDKQLKMRLIMAAQIKDARKELIFLQNAYNDFRGKYPPEIRNTMEMYLKLESAIFTKETQIKELTEENTAIEKCIKDRENVKAVINGNLYEEVTIETDGTKWHAKKLKNVTVKRVNDKISVYSN
jgi:uncharacterized protein (DUF342 family)